ncbi:hypothetical protein THRCLA_22121 [Thraustotheca clavata]|uniref:Uncharacterized protein n=1 Tax=Thraustotheca clavata TaxID=74557 RepID=A0A1V9ZC86_9STRA|nr:hypothetical protein THRCLA_22121 [Thraustotheca clavata]
MRAKTNGTTISYQQFESQSAEEVVVLRAIVVREACLDFALQLACEFTAPALDMLHALIQLRMASLDVVEAIALWRRILVRPMPFLWRGHNYLLRMAHDSDFLTKSSLATSALGMTIKRHNPFLTVPGLDMRHRIRDIALASDVALVIDVAEPSLPLRIHRAELLILLEEEERAGNEIVVKKDARWSLMVQREAEEINRMRFGLNHKVP